MRRSVVLLAILLVLVASQLGRSGPGRHVNWRFTLDFAGLVVVAAMGIVLFGVLAVVERQVTGWAYRGSTLTASSLQSA